MDRIMIMLVMMLDICVRAPMRPLRRDPAVPISSAILIGVCRIYW